MPVIEVDSPADVSPAELPHDSLKNGVIACAVVCFGIAAIFVGLRFYTRTRIIKVLAASDWFLLASLVRNHRLISYVLFVCEVP